MYLNNQTSKVLDPRGMFLIVAHDTIWKWVGAELLAGNQEAYTKAADHQIQPPPVTA